MTVRTNAIQICDRCLKPFQEKTLKAGDEVPALKQFGITIMQSTGTTKDVEKTAKVLLVFEDICPSCQSAVEGLIGRIRLDGGDGRGRKSDAKNGGRKRAPKTEKAPETPAEPPKTEGSVEAPGEGAAAGRESAEAPIVKAEVSAEPPSAPPAKESSEATSGALPEGAVRDEATGDVYDTRTGEVLSRGSSSKMPF